MIKKISKNTILITVGIILGLTVGVYAATTIASANVTYTNNSQSTVSGALDNLFSNLNNKTILNHNLKYIDKIKIGDYVKMTPTLTSYTIPASDTGYTEDQTINPSELNIWRIISINSDGTADAVSVFTSSKNVIFGKQDTTSKPSTIDATNENVKAYAKFIKTLNTIANQYQNSTYTTKVRHMGSAWGQTSEITDTTKLIQTTAPWTVDTSSSTTPADEILGGGDMGYEADYNLVKSVLGSAKANKKGTTTATAYWLASRRYLYGSSALWYFYARYVNANGSANSDLLYGRNGSSSYWHFYSKTYAIRPIITLKSGLTTSGGDGKSSSTAWTFS